MSWKKSLILLASAAIPFSVASCKPTPESETKKVLQDKYGMNEEQALACTVQMVKDKYGIEKKHEDGTITYEPNYMSISVEKKFRIVVENRETLDQLIKAKNPELKEWTRKMNPDLPAWLKKKKKVYDVLHDRYVYVMNFARFTELMGVENAKITICGKTIDLSQRRDPDGKLNFKGIELCHPLLKLDKVLPFKAEYLETARENDHFKVDHTYKSFNNTKIEIDNPDKTSDEDTIWVQRIRNLEVVCYETDEFPEEGVDVDYIEVYVLDKDGKRESKPAIRVFENSSGVLDVIVADLDREGTKGFGNPDYVDQANWLDTGSGAAKAFFESNQMLIDALFAKQDTEKNEKLEKEEDIKVKGPIVLKTGEAYIPEFDVKPEGWTLPGNIERYLEDKKKREEFDLYCMFKKEKPKGLNGEKKHKTHFIAYVAKDFAGNRRVVEFYRVKPEFREKVIKIAEVDSENHMIKLIVEGKSVQEQRVDFFLEDMPYKIEYDSQDMRYSIIDREPADDGVYESKKQFAAPSYIELGEDLETR